MKNAEKRAVKLLAREGEMTGRELRIKIGWPESDGLSPFYRMLYRLESRGFVVSCWPSQGPRRRSVLAHRSLLQ